MACTAKMPRGMADITGIALTTTNQRVLGPPAFGGVGTEGVYFVQSSPGSSATIRWDHDRPLTAGTASRSTWVTSGS